MSSIENAWNKFLSSNIHVHYERTRFERSELPDFLAWNSSCGCFLAWERHFFDKRSTQNNLFSVERASAVPSLDDTAVFLKTIWKDVLRPGLVLTLLIDTVVELKQKKWSFSVETIKEVLQTIRSSTVAIVETRRKKIQQIQKPAG